MGNSLTNISVDDNGKYNYGTIQTSSKLNNYVIDFF